MTEKPSRSYHRPSTILLGVIALAGASLVSVPLSAQTMQRPDVIGREAAVVSDHVLASAAGAAVLRRGGNAVDAAITMAGVLAVARPHMNGVGGDALCKVLAAASTRGTVPAAKASGRTVRVSCLPW